MGGEFAKMLMIGAGIFIFMFILLAAAPNLNVSPSGLFTAKSNYPHTMLAEGVWVSSMVFSLGTAEGTVVDKLGSERKDLLVVFKDSTTSLERGAVELTVRKAEGGELAVLINGAEVYREAAKPGRRYFNFDKNLLTGEDVLEVKAIRGADFWNSAEYDVKAEIKGETFSDINATFAQPSGYRTARLIVSTAQDSGKMTIKLNGEIIYEGQPDGPLSIELPKLQKTNTVEFTADTGAKHYVDWAEVRFGR